jgi:hypothetical protein
VKEEEAIEPVQEVIEHREVRGKKGVPARGGKASKQTSGKAKREVPDETGGAGVKREEEKRVPVRERQASKCTSGRAKRKTPDETVGAGVTGK